MGLHCVGSAAPYLSPVLLKKTMALRASLGAPKILPHVHVYTHPDAVRVVVFDREVRLLRFFGEYPFCLMRSVNSTIVVVCNMPTCDATQHATDRVAPSVEVSRGCLTDRRG